ncbi:MAG: respiratory nitrate reductase subunit gamma [Deltaproteobacteria bacterium]|nr:respiratory nitrate reductase subunit gamma [Deltaproteobacteria bacterium]
MHQVYGFVVGPLAWIAFAVFVLGSIWKMYTMYRSAKTRDGQVLAYWNLKYALRSIIHWSVPFWPVNSRRHPFMTIVSFTFHICLVLVPVFLLAHVMLWDYYHGFRFWSLPEGAADVMTFLVILACLVFAVRRILLREVRYVTSAMDWAVLAIVFLPFLTGFLAYHQIGPYRVMIILHILFGEIMLAAIPFTRLSHMLLSPFSRGYIGSEFGGVRKAKDW